MKLQLHHKIKYYKILNIQLEEKSEEFFKVVLTRIGFNQIMSATIILRIMLSALYCEQFAGV